MMGIPPQGVVDSDPPCPWGANEWRESLLIVPAWAGDSEITSPCEEWACAAGRRSGTAFSTVAAAFSRPRGGASAVAAVFYGPPGGASAVAAAFSGPRGGASAVAAAFSGSPRGASTVAAAFSGPPGGASTVAAAFPGPARSAATVAATLLGAISWRFHRLKAALLGSCLGISWNLVGGPVGT
jgi:hypothetical protein